MVVVLQFYCGWLLALLPMLLVRTAAAAASTTAADQQTIGVLALGIRTNDAATEVTATLESHRATLERLISTHVGCDGVQITRVEAATFAQVAAVRDEENAAELILIDFRAKAVLRGNVDEVGLRRSISLTLHETGSKLSVEDISVELNQDSSIDEEHTGGIDWNPLMIGAVFILSPLACCARRLVAKRKDSLSDPPPDIEAGLEKRDSVPFTPDGGKYPQSSGDVFLQQQDESQSTDTQAPCGETASEFSQLASTTDEMDELHADDYDADICSSEECDDEQLDQKMSTPVASTSVEVEGRGQLDTSIVSRSTPASEFSQLDSTADEMDESHADDYDDSYICSSKDCEDEQLDQHMSTPVASTSVEEVDGEILL